MKHWKDIDYALLRRFPDGDFDDVLARTRAALPAEGFGVLTEIDVRATMKKKLDADTPAYVILGGCNPQLALQALTAEPGVGVLLPCNVVVAQAEGEVVVGAIDPRKLFSLVGDPGIEPLADEVGARLKRVLEAI